jgi:aldose 1-epimerase
MNVPDLGAVAGAVALGAGPIRLVLFPGHGGRIGRLSHCGEAGVFDYLAPFDPASFDAAAWQRAGCFPMLPFTNKFRQNRLRWGSSVFEVAAPHAPPHFHGWGHRQGWSVQQADASSCTLSFAAAPDAHWPWSYTGLMGVNVRADGIDLTLQVTNLSAQPMPLGLGFHPYFDVGDRAEVTVHAASVWHGSPMSEGLPALQRHLDAPLQFGLRRHAMPRETFTWFCEGAGTAARIDYPGTGRQIVVSSPDARYLVVHHRAGEHCLCLEPSTHLAGRLDPTANCALPGEPVRLSMSLALG